MTTRSRAAAESSVRFEKRPRPADHDPAADSHQEWRDWTNLAPDLIGEIANHLLSHDVSDYHRFRAACKPWRDLTSDPRAHGHILDRRFRPRNWIVLAITPDSTVATTTRRRLLNLATGSSIRVDLPPLSTHCHMCSTDGLLVLYHRSTNAIRLLDPLTGVLTESPIFTKHNKIGC
uniref:F-box domain-containing protein n=1 Tax=Leersia perrieri TaxID=77586 RepID=A0A0D9VHT9_9ORYZ